MNWIKKIAAVFSGNIVFSLSSLAVATILVSNSGLEEYGRFVILQALFQGWVVVSKPLTWQAIVKYNDCTGIKTLLQFSFKSEVLASVFSLIIGWITFYFLDHFYQLNEYITILPYFLLCAIFYNNNTVLGFLRSTRSFAKVSMIQAWMGCSRIALAYLYYDDILLLFVISLIVDAFAWAVAMIYVYLKFRQIESNNYETAISFSDFISFSFWGSLSAILDLPITQLDRLLISALLGLESAGVLNLIKRISSVLNQIADPIYQTCFPEFSKYIYNKDYSSCKKMIINISTYMFILGGGALVTVWFSFDLINEIMFSNNLIDYHSELVFMMAVQVLVLIFIWVHPVFISEGFVKFNILFVTLSNSVYLCVLYFTLSIIGIWGAILAMLCQYLITISFKIYILRNRTFLFRRGA